MASRAGSGGGRSAPCGAAARLEAAERGSAGEAHDRADRGTDVAAALVLPEVTEAASTELSPSLKNFLLNIVSNGVVFAGITGVVVAVYNFDPDLISRSCWPARFVSR
ncbi:hypothetical protein D1007_47350 [Hordeum vulgare]|nr:hypothetical protein D1007_47350 [Hordeum vulgare]